VVMSCDAVLVSKGLGLVGSRLGGQVKGRNPGLMGSGLGTPSWSGRV